MVALYIIAGIIVFFALILSIRAHIHAEYEQDKDLIVWAKWAFLKIPILPAKEKPPKKKKEEASTEEKTEDNPPKEPKPKGANPLKNIYDNEQLQGIMDIFNKLLQLLDKFGRGIVNSFVIDEVFLDIDMTRGDAAQTAEEYGKMCRRIFPVVGAVCANCNVKKYSVNIEPDYIANPGTRVAFSMEISLNPRKLINAVLAFAFGAVFKIGIRLIKDLKPKVQPSAQPSSDGAEKADVKTSADKAETKNVNNTESGAI